MISRNGGVDVKRWMIFLLGFVVIFIVGYMAWNSEDGKQRDVRIVQEYQAIKHPEGAKLLVYELNRKFIKRWIHSRYIYPISNDEIKKYYDQEFMSKGWNQVPSRSKLGNIDERYTKDNLRLEFSLNKDNSWTLSMSYADAAY
jgi:hypothetical protein